MMVSYKIKGEFRASDQLAKQVAETHTIDKALFKIIDPNFILVSRAPEEKAAEATGESKETHAHDISVYVNPAIELIPYSPREEGGRVEVSFNKPIPLSTAPPEAVTPLNLQDIEARIASDPRFSIGDKTNVYQLGLVFMRLLFCNATNILSREELAHKIQAVMPFHPLGAHVARSLAVIAHPPKSTRTCILFFSPEVVWFPAADHLQDFLEDMVSSDYDQRPTSTQVFNFLIHLKKCCLVVQSPTATAEERNRYRDLFSRGWRQVVAEPIPADIAPPLISSLQKNAIYFLHKHALLNTTYYDQIMASPECAWMVLGIKDTVGWPLETVFEKMAHPSIKNILNHLIAKRIPPNDFIAIRLIKANAPALEYIVYFLNATRLEGEKLSDEICEILLNSHSSTPAASASARIKEFYNTSGYVFTLLSRETDSKAKETVLAQLHALKATERTGDDAKRAGIPSTTPNSLAATPALPVTSDSLAAIPALSATASPLAATPALSATTDLLAATPAFSSTADPLAAAPPLSATAGALAATPAAPPPPDVAAAITTASPSLAMTSIGPPILTTPILPGGVSLTSITIPPLTTEITPDMKRGGEAEATPAPTIPSSPLASAPAASSGANASENEGPKETKAQPDAPREDKEKKPPLTSVGYLSRYLEKASGQRQGIDRPITRKRIANAIEFNITKRDKSYLIHLLACYKKTQQKSCMQAFTLFLKVNKDYVIDKLMNILLNNSSERFTYFDICAIAESGLFTGDSLLRQIVYPFLEPNPIPELNGLKQAIDNSLGKNPNRYQLSPLSKPNTEIWINQSKAGFESDPGSTPILTP